MFLPLWLAITCADDARMAPHPSTSPPMILAATFSSTMLLPMPLSLKIQPRSSLLLWLTALLYRHLRSRYLRRRCPCVHVILTLASCGPHPMPAPQWLLGRYMCSSPSSLPQFSLLRNYPTTVLVTSWSSLERHPKSQSSLHFIALHLWHKIGCAQCLQQQSW